MEHSIIKKVIASIHALKISLGPSVSTLPLRLGGMSPSNWIPWIVIQGKQKFVAAYYKWEELSNHVSVKKVQREVNNASKRNPSIKRPTGSSKETGKKRE